MCFVIPLHALTPFKNHILDSARTSQDLQVACRTLRIQNQCLCEDLEKVRITHHTAHNELVQLRELNEKYRLEISWVKDEADRIYDAYNELYSKMEKWNAHMHSHITNYPESIPNQPSTMGSNVVEGPSSPLGMIAQTLAETRKDHGNSCNDTTEPGRYAEVMLVS